MNLRKIPRGSAGFSLAEVSLVALIVLVIAAIGLPNMTSMLRTYRLSGDARNLAHQLTLARLRAGTDFTWAQIVISTSVTPNSYSLQLCTTKATSSCTTFTSEGGTQYLSPGISLGFGSSSGAAGGQTSRVQTTTVAFNSRGIPIDSTGSVTANDTIYLTETTGKAYAVSVTLSGHPKIWRYTGSSWVSV
jgi:Tfp pilus assembly protein FimT